MKISAILLCFNQEKYIREALFSLLQQEIPPDVELDVVVADDHSTDGSWEIITKEVETYRKNGGSLPIVLNQNKTNLGCCGNLYQAVQLCHGDYIVKFDGDDISFKERISVFKQTYDKYPGALQYSYKYVNMAEDGTVKPSEEAKQNRLETISVKQYDSKTPSADWSFAFGGVSVFSRALFDSFRDFSMVKVCDDTVLSIRARLLHGKVVDSSRVVVYYRSTPISGMHTTGLNPKIRFQRSAKRIIPAYTFASCEAVGLFQQGKLDYAESAFLLRTLYAWQMHYTLYPYVAESHSLREKWQWFRAWSIIQSHKWFIGLKIFLPQKLLDFLRKHCSRLIAKAKA